jgi:hypothetical protein
MRKFMGVFALMMFVAAPAGAQSTGMAAMQYYAGSWSCIGGPTGQKPVHATATYTLDSGILREWVDVPAQGKMTKPYLLSIVTTYDSKNGRYVQVALDSDVAWSVTFGRPLMGNTEQWADHLSSTGKLGHGQTIRTNQNAFTYTGYDTLTSAKPNFKVTCRRSSA